MAVVRKPQTQDESEWPALTSLDDDTVGDMVDADTAHRLSLAFTTLDKFPDFVRRHRRFVGGATATAVISTTAVMLAYRAIHGRLAKGESATDALKSLTEEEVEKAGAFLRRIRRPKKG